MIRRVIATGCLVFLWGVWAVAAEAGSLYLCDDGGTVLLTDVEAFGCPRYVPATDITVVRDGASWSEVEWAVATAHPERFAPRPDRGRAITAGRICGQWADLNLRTDGGLDMETAEQTRGWLALSRIVTATGVCEQALNERLYPDF